MNFASRVTLGVTLVGLAALGGVLTHRLTRPRATLQPGTAAVLPARAARPEPARTIPMVLPDLTLPDANGIAHRLSDWAGHPLVVNFWATWCEPCRREIPLLIRLRHERAARGVAIVGIAIDFRAAVVKYAAAAAIDYPLLIGEDAGLKTVDAFGMQLVFPFTVFADREARVVAVKVGELHQDEADFILDRVEDIDRGSLTLAAAREAIAARLRDLAVQRAKHA
ncbi:MAG TPA: TlpA disulfide reductase family protein [Steroidobacteraceae bacterium]